MKAILRIILLPITLVRYMLDGIRVKRILSRANINDLDKISGADFEQVIAYLLRYTGFRVTQTPSSHDYGADLILAKWGIKIAVQCKLYYGHSVGNKAIMEAYGAKDYYHCNYALVITNSHYSNPAQNMAKSLNVALIDRFTLVKLLTKPYKNNINIIKNIIITSTGK